MATKNFRSTVLDPTSEFAYGDKLRFTALATVGEVLKGSFSEATIGEDGVYSVDLQYGKHRIDYKPYEGVWRHFADVEVNADTLATTLQDLALASAPVTDETILVLQGILADAEAVKEESAAIRDEAAASADNAALSAASLADASFFKRYSFSAGENYLDGVTGNYTLVKIDEYSQEKFEMHEYPVYSLSATGIDAASLATVVPMTASNTPATGNTVLFSKSGGVDIRVFFGKSSEESSKYSLYFATRNVVHNNASVSLNVSTYKKLNSEIIGAVNIDNWLAINSSITEATKIEIGAA